MLAYQSGKLLLDGEPVIVLSGEVHYFRLPPDQWQDRLDRLKECGMNAVATYVPWVAHEYTQGDIDLTGRTHPSLNLTHFLKLCRDNGLMIILRPGPFIMAEMKNEGIPYWVYGQCPDALITSFEGIPATTHSLDYLDPTFLSLVRRWYQAVLGLAREHLPKAGGSMVMVQLDNEVGMLDWVSNRPNLNDNSLHGLLKWLHDRYPAEELALRYPFKLDHAAFSRLRTPEAPYDLALQQDLGFYMRGRFAAYIRTLREYAAECGMEDVLYVVNIHGTSAGRGLLYPIGVSQLMEAVRVAPDVISGSDVYFDNMAMNNFHDMVLANGITACINDAGKPLTSMEFNAGDSNFGDDFMGRSLASASDHKTRLFLALGNRLLNYYLFCGGQNARFPDHRDMNDRWSFTGENHGYAAPIGPEGVPSKDFARLSRVTRQLMAQKKWLATSELCCDNVAFGFVPDDYMTEYHADRTQAAREMYAAITDLRAGNCWDASVRSLLLLGVMPRVINLQDDSRIDQHCVIVAGTPYMSAQLQRKLADHVLSGGSLLLHGRFPIMDREGNGCTLLADALGVRVVAYRSGLDNMAVRHAGAWAGHRELHVDRYEAYEGEGLGPLLSTYRSEEICAFTRRAGDGTLAVIGCPYKAYLAQYRALMAVLQITPDLIHDIDVPGVGVFIARTRHEGGGEYLHLINMDDVEKDFHVRVGARPWMQRKIHLPANDALMLPRKLDLGFATIEYSSMEVLSIGENRITLRNTEPNGTLLLSGPMAPQPAAHLNITTTADGGYHVEVDSRLLKESIPVHFA